MALDVAFVQLKEPIAIGADGSLDYACLPPYAREWYKQLPMELNAYGWGTQEVDNPRSLATRLKHIEVLSRARSEWSWDIRTFSDYSRVVSQVGLNGMFTFYVLSPRNVNGTTLPGDSGSGIVLRRRLNGTVNGMGDVLYGYTTYISALRYSMNESGGEPEINRLIAKATPIPHILGGSIALPDLFLCCLLPSCRPLCISRPLWQRC